MYVTLLHKYSSQVTKLEATQVFNSNMKEEKTEGIYVRKYMWYQEWKNHSLYQRPYLSLTGKMNEQKSFIKDSVNVILLEKWQT